MSDHVDRSTLLAYIDGETSVDRHAIATHIATCFACRESLEELQQMVLILSDRDLFDLFECEDRDGASERLALLRAGDEAERAGREADRFLEFLERYPVSQWSAEFDAAPAQRTAAAVCRLVLRVESELDRAPERALEIAGVAEHLAVGFEDSDEKRRALGDVWKHRANAFRHLGHFDEALQAASIAEAFYDALMVGDVDVAQAQYTRAATYFKMTRLADARLALVAAIARLRRFGTTLALAKTMMLEAAIRHEEGNVDGAYELWRDVVPLLERFGDTRELARIRTNLAEYRLAKGRFDEALIDARAAIRGFEDLHMDIERTRAEWTTAMILLAMGGGVELLESVAAAFARLGMDGDAGFARLDLTEELLRRGEWERAEVVAREIEPVFRRAGATLAKVRAAAYLRESVEKRQASVDTVRYVRAFIAEDSAEKTFAPPSGEN